MNTCATSSFSQSNYDPLHAANDDEQFTSLHLLAVAMFPLLVSMGTPPNASADSVIWRLREDQCSFISRTRWSSYILLVCSGFAHRRKRESMSLGVAMACVTGGNAMRRLEQEPSPKRAVIARDRMDWTSNRSDGPSPAVFGEESIWREYQLAYQCDWWATGHFWTTYVRNRLFPMASCFPFDVHDIRISTDF